MTSIQRIACLGEVMIELSPAGDDLTRIGVAGDTFNTAVYLRRAVPETRVAYVTALGDDAMSERILSSLREEAIETDLVERREGSMPGLYMISVDETGERSFTYWRSAAAARTLFSEPARITPEALDAFDLVYLSGISLAILPQAVRSRFWDWAEGYRARGGRIAFDSNYRPRLWEDVETARRETMHAWAHCDVALPSVDDEIALFGDADAAGVVARLAGAGVAFGALKRGPDGPLGLGPDPQSISVPEAPRVVDTTAAGDSFNAGFLAAFAKGEAREACMAAGHALAVKVIGHRGAILPRTAEPA